MNQIGVFALLNRVLLCCRLSVLVGRDFEICGWTEVMSPDLGNFMKGISHTKSLTLKEESGGFFWKRVLSQGGGGLPRE